MSTEQIKLNDEPAKYLWLIVLVLGLIGVFVVFLTEPPGVLLGEGGHAIKGALHGAAAILFMITATVGLYQGYRIFAGQARSLAELQIGRVVNATLAFITILLGNWIYIPYRATGGPREYFLQTSPEIHKIFFEFKEFVALFTLPLAVSAAFLLVYYGVQAVRQRGLAVVTSILLALVFFYFFVAFGLGAAITKLKAV